MAKVRAMLASSKVFQPPTSWRHHGALLTARTQSQGRLFSWSLFWSSFCLSLVYLWESDCLKSHPLKNEISPLTAYLSKWLSRRWRVMSICPAPISITLVLLVLQVSNVWNLRDAPSMKDIQYSHLSPSIFNLHNAPFKIHFNFILDLSARVALYFPSWSKLSIKLNS